MTTEQTTHTDQPQGEGPLRASAERLRHELDRWMEAAFSQGERAMDAMGLRMGRAWGPGIDMIERPDSVLVLANVPGIDPDRIDLSLAGNMLTLQGEFPTIEAGSGETPHAQERPRGTFRRSIPLPTSVNPETIRAECRLGVLYVTIGKVEKEKARKIPVKLSSQPSSPAPGF
jgi:HSP20 family protein